MVEYRFPAQPNGSVARQISRGNRMKNICLKISLLLGVLISTVLPIDSWANPLKIGVVAPLTGPAATSGETVRNSIILAQEKFDPQKSVDFVFEDDQLQPKNTVTSVNKLISHDRVDGLIVFGSPTSLAVNSIAEQNKLPMVALSIVDKVVAGKSYVFKHWVSSRVENELVVAEVKRRGYNRIAIIASTNDAMLAMRDHFAASKFVDIVYSEDFPSEESDFRSAVTKIRQANPDAVYNLLWSPQPAIFAKALRGGGYVGPMFGVHNLEDPKQIEASDGTLNGAWFVTGDDSAAAEYYRDYEQRFGVSPAAGGPNAFDVAKMYIEAIKVNDIAKFLRSLNNFHGAYGEYGATGHNDFMIKAAKKSIADGKIIS